MIRQKKIYLENLYDYPLIYKLICKVNETKNNQMQTLF